MKYPCQLPILLFLTNVLLPSTTLSTKCFRVLPFCVSMRKTRADQGCAAVPGDDSEPGPAGTC